MSVRRLEPGQVIGGFVLESPDPAAAIPVPAASLLARQSGRPHHRRRASELQPTALSRQCVLARGRGGVLHGDGRQSGLSGAALAIIRKSAVYCGLDRSCVGAKRTSGCSGAGSAGWGLALASAVEVPLASGVDAAYASVTARAWVMPFGSASAVKAQPRWGPTGPKAATHRVRRRHPAGRPGIPGATVAPAAAPSRPHSSPG